MAIVTISRKLGSLGDEIAGLVAVRLGYRLISREEFHRIGRECDREFRDACKMFETEKGRGGFLERLFYREPAYTSLFASLNYSLASGDRVVILGRGAQIVLAEEPGVFKARVVAPMAVRAERIAARENLSLDDAAESVRRWDSERRSMLESIFHRSLADWSLYDLVINTAALSKELAADLIVHMVEESPEPAGWEEHKARFRRLSFAAEVESAVKKKVVTSAFRDIKVSCPAEGVVRLLGVVQDRRGRAAAEEAALGHPGVREVENKLKTTDLSF